MALFQVLLFLILASALAAYGIALWSAIAIVRLAPPGLKFRTYCNFGWWRFNRVRETVGVASEPHIRRYRSAFLIFLAVIVSVMLTATIAVVRS